MKLKTLTWIALSGAVITSATGLILSALSHKKIKSSPFYQEALKLLRNNSTAVKLLGEPIKDYQIRINDLDAKGCDDRTCWITVPVEGPKSKGHLRYWVTIEEPYKIPKVELSVDKIPGKKLVIKDETNLNNTA